MSQKFPIPDPGMPPDEWNRKIGVDPAFSGFMSWQAIRAYNLRIFYETDLGDDLSHAREALLDRVISMQVQLELVDSRMLQGKPMPDDYTKVATTLLRLLKELGLERKAKGAANDLASYLTGKVGNDVAKTVQPGEGGMPSWLGAAG